MPSTTEPSIADARRVDIVVVGVSTGGPSALAQVAARLPADLPVPLLVVQHMPPVFTRLLAERLTAQGTLPWQEAVSGEPLRPARGLVAPGDMHLAVVRQGNHPSSLLHQGPPENSCRPAVDVLFRSVVEVYGSRVLAVVMTGMGSDGLKGVQLIKAAGGKVIVQDEASSVVWGMPGAVARAGLADQVLALGEIAPRIVRMVKEGREWSPPLDMLFAVPASSMNKPGGGAEPSTTDPGVTRRSSVAPPVDMTPVDPVATQTRSRPDTAGALATLGAVSGPARPLPGASVASSPVSLPSPPMAPPPVIAPVAPIASVPLVSTSSAVTATPVPTAGPPRAAAPPAMSAEDFRYVSDFVYKNAAIVLESGKEYLAESRLSALGRRLGSVSIPEIVSRLRTGMDPELARAVIDAMTTNETSFFRDVDPFETMRSMILPDLLRRRQGERAIRIWCGACSSGQEVYSIAMLLKEHFGAQLADWQVRIKASDISREMVERCREGRYSQLEVNRGLPAHLLVKYFEREGTHWRVASSLRGMVDGFEMNLAAPWPDIGKADVIFLRNVLIYFDDDTKRLILDKLRRILRPDGYLFLGGAETTLRLDERFVRETAGRSSMFRLRG